VISGILDLEDGPTKTARLAAWIQSLSGEDDQPPVLVGGGAVELVTGGAYTTGDLDFVGSISPAVSRSLVAAGFERHGRHWVHELAQVFIEFPSDRLGTDERADWFDVAGERILMISLEDLLVDRLGAWQYWQSSVDAVNAWMVWRTARSAIDLDRLERRVQQAGWERAWVGLRSFGERWQDGEPSREEMESWAMTWP